MRLSRRFRHGKRRQVGRAEIQVAFPAAPLRGMSTRGMSTFSPKLVALPGAASCSSRRRLLDFFDPLDSQRPRASRSLMPSRHFCVMRLSRRFRHRKRRQVGRAEIQVAFPAAPLRGMSTFSPKLVACRAETRSL